MASSSSLLGLDRKAMEEERLARLARKRGLEDAVDTASSAKAAKTESKDDSTRKIRSPAAKTSIEFNEPENLNLKYPCGVIKRTWAYGFERDNDIKIEEVLQKSDLNIAVLSSFDWDLEWLLTKLDLTTTKLMLVMQAKDEDEKNQYRREAVQWQKSFRLCFPPMPTSAYGTMHSKLMLLFFPGFLRCVVPSSNLVPYDWGETGVMENSVFLIDLPRLQVAQQGSENPTTTNFSRELLRFLEAMEISQDVKEGLLKFDFSATANIAFVHSVAGSHFGDEALRTGYPQMSQAIRDLGLNTDSQTSLEVDLCSSSVGSLDQTQVETMYRAIRGLDPHEPAQPKSSKAGGPGRKLGSSSGASTADEEADPLESRFRLVFPSKDAVQASRGGEQSGGTIFLRAAYYAKPTFPRAILRDFRSTRAGLLSHNKLIFARTPRTAFAYCGSANLSQAAWGRLTWDRARKERKLYVGNWECGVVLPVVSARGQGGEEVKTAGGDEGGVQGERDEDEISTESEGAGEEAAAAARGEGGRAVLPMSVFDGVVDVPFRWPAPRYGEGQVPWSAQ